MRSGRWLDVLVRSRRVHEDVARAEAARALRAQQATLLAARDIDLGLSTAPALPDGVALGFVAAATARNHAAHALAAALVTLRQDTAVAATTQAAAVAAAQQRRTVEKLAERRAAAARVAAEQADQRALDEIRTAPGGRP